MTRIGYFLLLWISVQFSFAQTISTSAIGGSPFCPGANVNVPYTITGTFNAGNIFTAQLSDAAGSFASAVNIGFASSTTAGTIAATIPNPQAGGTAYRIRVVSSNPGVIGTQSATVLTVTTWAINTPTLTGTTFCPGQAVTVNYTLANSCAIPNTPSANVFTAQLSDSFGSFTTPTAIGTNTSNTSGSISTTLPTTAIAGTGYRIRIISSNPGAGLTSPINGSNLTINAINLNAPTITGTTFCPGATFNVNYTLVSGCAFFAGNTFTAELSDGTGSFASPVVIGNVTATAAGPISVTIPTNTAAGNAYRIRVVSANPVRTSPINASALTVTSYGINAPTFTGTSFCQGQAFTVAYTIQNSCSFPNTPSNNVFTAQLSNATGSFASPTPIGSLTTAGSGSISATIPLGTPAGTAYRIRVVSANPGAGVVGSINAVDLTVNASSGNPTVFGTTAWNNYVYAGTAFPITNNNYVGTYSENNLSFNTTSRWNAGTGPSVADASTGNAYAGCPVGGTNYSVSFKRTNFTCGYYQVDLPSHDDDVRFYVDGVLVFSHVGGCCDSHPAAWTGFLNASSTVDIQVINFGGNGNLQATFNAAANPLTISPPVTVCSTASTSLTVSSPLTLNYSWTPTTGLTPSNGLGASVTASPATTTTYTATGSDPITGCSVSRTVLVTVVAPATVPTIVLTNVPSTICSGITTATLTASGANTYTWSPATGLSATTGNVVIANPASTTTYTVTGSTGCQVNTQMATVTVQVIPAAPPTTTFGNATWNVFAHNNTTLSNYYGYYTENNLSFNTSTRWAPASGPSVANSTTGTAYSGCSFGSTNYSVSFKRTNFTCGYYQINIPYQDDALTLLVDNVQVFQNNAFTSTLQTNVWTGFLGPTSTVEFRLVNNGGPGQLSVAFVASTGSPQTLSPNVTICAGTNTGLTAVSPISGATYSWSVSPVEPTISFTPSATTDNPFFQTTAGTPAGVYTVTNVLTDAAGTGCSAPATVTVTVDPLPNTAVTPTSATVSCPTAGVTLTATGANTYTWNPSTGLSATTGFSVIATPAITTTYTVTGSNNCSTNSAMTTITVTPLPAYTTFPTGTWNAYGFNSTTIGTNYQGYYTENGSGPSGLNFDTRNRWTSGGAPSTANATNGTVWQGCAMNSSNISMSFKRTNFTCGVYQLDVPAHDDDFLLFVNGVQVAQHLGCCDAHTNVWTGTLNSASTVEWQLRQGGGGSYLQVSATMIAQPATTTVWTGAVDTNWFNTANWCGGVPTSTIDALIPAAGPQNMPVINNTGAVVRNITISPAIPAGTYNLLIPAASLTMNSFSMDVYGNWIGNGTFTANAGTVHFTGTGAGNTISGTVVQTFNNLIINKTNGITISSGTTRVSGIMTFTSGIVTQSSILQILNGGSVTGASNTSYVDGIVTKIGNAAFTFPVGQGGFYRPIGISAPTTATDTYTARYFYTNPTVTYPNAQRAVTIDHVSGGEYWMLNRTAGGSTVNVTLSWDTNSGGVSTPATLKVAAWNGSLWTDLGNAGTTGNATAGTVVSASATALSGPFTLATGDGANALPVQLISFNCGLDVFGQPELVWTTASEINSDYFEVQRASEEKGFETIGRLQAQGNSRERTTYTFQDQHAATGKNYYRLKQVDRDRRATYYDACVINVGSFEGFTLFPNPTSGQASVNLRGFGFQGVSVTNTVGQNVEVDYRIEDNVLQLHSTSLPSGIYLVMLTLDGHTLVLKLVRN